LNLFNRKVTRDYIGDDKHRRLTVNYGFDEKFAKKKKIPPYFSIWGELQIKLTGEAVEWGEGGVCIDEDIEKIFPELAFLLKWKLVNIEGVPLNYKATCFQEWRLYNSAGKNQGTLNRFKSACVFGVVRGDEYLWGIFDHATDGRMSRWLQNRLPLLRTAFIKDILKAKNIKFRDVDFEDV